MDSDNWVVQNLENALDTWNSKMAEVWSLLTMSPQSFKGGGIWQVILQINGAVKGIGLALLVLFFLVGVVKTSGSLTEVKRPEHALKLFIRFAIAKGVVTYGLDLMMALFDIAQGIMRTIMNASGIGRAAKTTLPSEMVTAIEDCGFFESIPLWAVTLIGSLFITVLSFIIILTVYGRFFRLYLYTAIAPVPLSTFAGQPTQSIGVSFLKSYAGVCLEGAIIVLACIIFSKFAATPPVVDKGYNFNHLMQPDIDLMMSHINSYTRKKLGNLSPYRLFSSFYGEDLLTKLNIQQIAPNDINLTPKLLRR